MLAVYTVFGSKQEAERIARALLKKKLIACANLFPIQSHYTWKGRTRRAKEWAMLAKTVAQHKKHIITEATRLHSYEIPCIAFYNAAANPAYEQWVRRTLQ